MKFHAWLMKNRWRADPIGDLARDVHRDANWPKSANAWLDIKDLLPHSASDGAGRALRAAWNEFELFVGGPSHLPAGTWVGGVTGTGGLPEPKEEPKRSRAKHG